MRLRYPIPDVAATLSLCRNLMVDSNSVSKEIDVDSETAGNLFWTCTAARTSIFALLEIISLHCKYIHDAGRHEKEVYKACNLL